MCAVWCRCTETWTVVFARGFDIDSEKEWVEKLGEVDARVELPFVALQCSPDVDEDAFHDCVGKFIEVIFVRESLQGVLDAPEHFSGTYCHYQ